MHPINRDIGAYIKADNISHVPSANSAGTRNGTSHAINDTRSIVLAALTGAATGSPTTLTVTYKLQRSSDNSTFADATDADGNTLTVSLTAASSVTELNVNLVKYMAEDSTHYRFLETVAFTGGTSPTILSAATITKGPGQSLPL